MNDVANGELESERNNKEKLPKPTDLNDTYFNLFRYNYEQGFFVECLVPILFHYILGTFNVDWAPTQNTLLVYLIILFGYTRI
jgi:hypothetical protein